MVDTETLGHNFSWPCINTKMKPIACTKCICWYTRVQFSVANKLLKNFLIGILDVFYIQYTYIPVLSFLLCLLQSNNFIYYVVNKIICFLISKNMRFAYLHFVSSFFCQQQHHFHLYQFVVRFMILLLHFDSTWLFAFDATGCFMHIFLAPSSIDSNDAIINLQLRYIFYR